MPDRVVPFGFVLLWSSSFIASRVGLRHLSPLLFVALRMVLCSLVLVALMLLLRRPWGVLRNGVWLHCAVAGVLLNGVLLMTAHYAMERVGAVPIALIQTLNPLLTAVLAWPVLGERLQPQQWLGLVLGASGVVLIVGLAAADSPADLYGLLLTVGGVVGLSGGTLYFGRFCRSVPMLQGTTMQFLACTVVCGLATWLLESPYSDGTLPAFAAIAWNAGAVSLGGMVLYFVMLRRGTAARASANFYLVPGVAALLAWVLLGEALSPLTILGLVVSSIGCWLVNWRPGLAAHASAGTSSSSPSPR
jgi:drug/metabolite transporter (DMT)-like permease